MKRLELYFIIPLIIGIILITISIGLIQGCSKTVEVAEPTYEVIVPAEATKEPVKLAENMVADYFLGALKVVEITDKKVIVTTSLTGTSETIILNKKDISLKVNETAVCYEIYLKDNTGASVSISLGSKDYSKFISLLCE